MNSDTVVLDISSDEDVGWDGSKEICDGDDHNWLTELLDEVDRETDDSDDVVVVSEVVVNPKQRLKAVSLKGWDNGGVDDDDCVILDGDPDKPVTVRNDDDGGDDSDDLLVVSEKGQVACRDYPHPRHLCVQFPFSSTPHESHCGLCHCYVCDSLAPCVHWGAGSSSADHCHATEKDEFWRLERKIMRTGDKGLPASKAADESVAARQPLLNQIQQLTASHQPVGGLNNQVPRPTLRACSMSTNFPIISQSRSQRNGCSVPTNKFQPNLVSQQLLNMGSSTNSRDRRHHSASGHLGPQFSRTAFKRTGSAGVAVTVNQCSYNSPRITHGSHYSRCSPPLVTSSRNHIRVQESHGRISGSNTYVGPLQPLMGNVFDLPPPSIPLHFQSQLPPHPTANIPFENPVLFQSEVLSPPLNGDSTSVDAVPSNSQVSVKSSYLVPSPSQLQMSSVTNYLVPPEPQESSLPNYSLPSLLPNYQLLSQPRGVTPQDYLVSSQPQVPSQSSVTASSEPQVNTRYIPVSNFCQSITQPRAQTQTAIDPDFDFNWITHSSENSQQPSARSLQAEGVAPRSEFPLVGDPGLADDFQYDSWIFDNQPVEPGNADVTLSSGLNGLSPESGLLDTGGERVQMGIFKQEIIEKRELLRLYRSIPSCNLSLLFEVHMFPRCRLSAALAQDEHMHMIASGMSCIAYCHYKNSVS